MTAAETVRGLYQSAEAFRDDLAAHLVNGYVFSTPEDFVMARPVNLSAPHVAIVNPWHSFEHEDPNAWLVYAAAGSRQNVLAFLPYPLEYLAWHRRGGPLRVYKLDRCASLILQ